MLDGVTAMDTRTGATIVIATDADVTPSHAAVTCDVPAVPPVATPVELTVTPAVGVQVTAPLRSAMVPSEKLPVAFS